MFALARTGNELNRISISISVLLILFFTNRDFSALQRSVQYENKFSI